MVWQLLCLPRWISFLWFISENQQNYKRKIKLHSKYKLQLNLDIKTTPGTRKHGHNIEMALLSSYDPYNGYIENRYPGPKLCGR